MVELFKEITLFKATKDAVKGDGGSKFLLRRTKRLKVSLHRIYAAPLKSIRLFLPRGNFARSLLLAKELFTQRTHLLT